MYSTSVSSAKQNRNNRSKEVKSKMVQQGLPFDSPSPPAFDSASSFSGSLESRQLPLPFGEAFEVLYTREERKARAKDEREARAAAKEAMKVRRDEGRGRRKSLGKTVPQPRRPDGSAYACPCGRTYLLVTTRGMYLFMDRDGGLDHPCLGGDGFRTTEKKAKRLLDKFGCELHVREDQRRLEESR